MSKPVYSTYVDETLLPYFFCPGCGHGMITDHLNAALVKLQIDPHKVVVVTDIGCSGLADKYFTTNAFHGLHGRSVTYATGIKLANPDLKVIVLMGDGGCGIGGHHLIYAARRNIGVTVVVFNNLNYGMTGGQHSVTTPIEGVTSSTPYGQLEQPMDICLTVAVNGASFVARTTAFDRALPDLLVNAIQNEGFSLVDIWELCTAYYVPNNRFSKNMLVDTLSRLNFPTGIIRQANRGEFSRMYREVVVGKAGEVAMPARLLQAKYVSGLKQRMEIIVAGAAGRKINSATTLFCRGAVLSGLWATQRNDYPVTVKSGHSVSEVILSPEEIGFTGISRPNLLFLLFEEALPVVKEQLAAVTDASTVVVNANLLPIQTKGTIIPIDFSQTGRWASKREYWTIIALAKAIEILDIYPIDAFKEAVSVRSEFAEDNLAAIEAGENLHLPSA